MESHLNPENIHLFPLVSKTQVLNFLNPYFNSYLTVQKLQGFEL